MLQTPAVAGLPCTDWRVVQNSDRGTACVTDDGVVLRSTHEQPNEGLAEASTVTYAARPDSLFVPPAAFEFIPSPAFPQIKPDMRFTRTGQSTVAGTPCTEWKLKPADKSEDWGTACITDYGLILSVTSLSVTQEKSSNAAMTATVIGYTPQPDSAFEPPAGFRREAAR